MSRLLSARNRRTGAASAVVSTGQHGTAELPPYEPPLCPLNETAKRALADIANSQNTRKYQDHLKQSARLLADSVGGMNDRLRERRKRATDLAEKGDAAKMDEARVAKSTADRLEEEVNKLTIQSEEAIRRVIDGQAEIEDEKSVLASLTGQLRAQERQHRPEAGRRGKRRRNADESDNDEADGERDEGDNKRTVERAPPVVSAMELLQNGRADKATEYGNLSMFHRYGEHNDYNAFKKQWHDAQHADDGVAVPDPSTWFDEATGAPRMSAPADDNDDDLVVSREVISVQCPLTLQIMKEPYTSNVCKHTFEKSGILQFLRETGGRVRCPVPGCDKEFTAKDFYEDKIMLRKIQRAQQAQESQGLNDTSDADPDNEGDDDAMDVDNMPVIKTEKPRRGRVRREAIDDIEDE